MVLAIGWCVGTLIASLIYGSITKIWSFEGFLNCTLMTAWLYCVGAIT